MKEALEGYTKRVVELVDHVRGNEQATRQSLIGPLFTLLGYDLTDPRQCLPEYKCDFGEKRSVKPIDWAFLRDGKPIFFVEAIATAHRTMCCTQASLKRLMTNTLTSTDSGKALLRRESKLVCPC